MTRLTGLLGIVVILAVAWLLSRHKKQIKVSILLWGLGLQFGFAVLVLKTSVGKLFQAASAGVTAMLHYSEAGASFVFGDTLGKSSGSMGTVFAFQVLPIIIFIASFFSILYYLGVMQILVKAFAIVMQKVMGASGAESLNVAASIFMGQTEAPLTIRPFIAGLTESELFTIMVSGMAHVSGRRDGGLRVVRACGDSAPADRGDHDCARDHHAGQDHAARGGYSGDGGQSGSEAGEYFRQRH